MKCEKCGFENKTKSKFCTKCGHSLIENQPESTTAKSNNSKYVIVALIIVIIMLAGVIGYFALNSGVTQSNDNPQTSTDSNDVESADSSDEGESAKTTSVSSSKSKSKEWVSIGSYSGSGSGTKTINVPKGKIKVELSAFPIKNYATNHLYVSGTNGQSGGVDWGSTSAVETRSDSFTYTSNSEEEFTIDYYETVSWEVKFYRYQ
nr:zinc ribbon domain-containing protein [uncultured Methanobrevibacter sp.]